MKKRYKILIVFAIIIVLFFSLWVYLTYLEIYGSYPYTQDKKCISCIYNKPFIERLEISILMTFHKINGLTFNLRS